MLKKALLSYNISLIHVFGPLPLLLVFLMLKHLSTDYIRNKEIS